VSAKAQKTAAKVMAPKEGTILDRGYAAYTGRYTPEASRWKVIASRTLRMAARQWWAILLLIATVIPLLVAAVRMWIMSKLFALAPPGIAVESPDTYVMLPWGTMTLAFLIALFSGAGQVADDTRAGAFQFYFARPVTRDQYLAGKVVPVVSLTLFIALLPALLLSLLRLALLPSGAEVLKKLPLVGATLITGTVEALALAIPAVAISSLSRRRSYVQGGYAILYLLPWVVGNIFVKITRSAWPSLLSVPAHLENLARFVYRMPLPEGEWALPVWISATYLALLIAGSLALLRRRLAAVEVVAS
jgi:ABC-type transport system involved in multi-copper enzyme maturation permease subunit